MTGNFTTLWEILENVFIVNVTWAVLAWLSTPIFVCITHWPMGSFFGDTGISEDHPVQHSSRRRTVLPDFEAKTATAFGSGIVMRLDG